MDRRALWAITLVSLPLVVAAQSQQVPSGYALQQKYGSSYLYHVPTELAGAAWTNRPWLGRAAPYAAARADSEGRFARARFDAEDAFARLGGVALKNPADALAQFRWATLGFLIARRAGERGIDYWAGPGKHRLRAQLRWALALAPDPANAEYDRMRFLYEAASSKADVFRELGKRLVLRWPNDEALRRNQAQNLSHSKVEKDVDKAIVIANGLLGQYPSRLRYIGLKGYIHQAAWLALHRRTDGLACVFWYEKYLRLAPSEANNLQGMRRAVAYLRAKVGVGGD